MNKIYSSLKIIELFSIVAIIFVFLNILIQENSLEKEDMLNTMQTKKFEFLIDNIVNDVPIKGLSMAVTRENKTIYSKQFGEGINEHASFILGSTSKSFTAVATLIMISEYGLSLNDYANKYLPWISSEITLLDLLNHTSGISTYEKMNNIKYLGKRGEFEYSNTNYNILGEIIAVVTDDTFSNYIKKHIFDTLNMNDSFALSEDTSDKIVSSYQSYFGIPITRIPEIPNKSTWIQVPSGYLCSSSFDLEKYLQFMLRYSQGNISLLQNIKSNGVAVHDNAAINGIYSNTGIYGFGWINKNVNGTDILYHTGKTSTFTSICVLIPQKNMTITILCNMGDFLVGTNLIEKFYESAISIALETNEISYVAGNEYWKQHSIINVTLLLLLFLSILPFIVFIMSGKPLQSDLLSICKFSLMHIVAPAIIISIFPIIQLPYKVGFDFAPDISFIIVVSSINLFWTGLLKIVLFCIKH